MRDVMKVSERYSPYAHWLLRAAVGSVFLYHGFNKIFYLEKTAQMLIMSSSLIFIVALMEISGAVLILLGGVLKEWMTRVGAIILIPVIFTAILLIHLPIWDNFTRTYSHPMGGMEFQVALLLINLFLLIIGNSLNKGLTLKKKRIYT
jgi:putative oxidoreductase